MKPDGALPPDHPANRLRRLAEVLAVVATIASCDTELADDAAWLVRAAEEYLEGAAAGVNIEQALGLRLAPGARPWWIIEARYQRDELIRQVRATFFADLELPAAAEQIRRSAARAARQKQRPESGPGAALVEASRFMAIPQTSKKVREILEVK